MPVGRAKESSHFAPGLLKFGLTVGIFIFRARPFTVYFSCRHLENGWLGRLPWVPALAPDTGGSTFGVAVLALAGHISVAAMCLRLVLLTSLASPHYGLDEGVFANALFPGVRWVCLVPVAPASWTFQWIF